MRYFRIFWVFFKVSALTPGGGYAMVPIFQVRLEKEKLLSEKAFLQSLGLAQCLPGPIAFNVSRLCGQQIAGGWGSFAATLGVVIPPFFSVILVSLVLNWLQQAVWLEPFLSGVYGAALGLVGGMVYKVYRSQKWPPWKLAIVGGGIAFLFLFPSWVLALILALLVTLYPVEKRGRTPR